MSAGLRFPLAGDHVCGDGSAAWHGLHRYGDRVIADDLMPRGLAEPYTTALRLALDFIAVYPAQVVAITASGSVIQGRGDPLSDLDLWVVVDGEHRQRIQVRFNGVPCELFFNPQARIASYFEEEARDGRASSIGLTLDGEVLYDPHGVAKVLREQAAKVRQAGPQVPDEAVVLRKYGIVDALDNARDTSETDALMSTLLCAEAVKASLRLAYVLGGTWTPRDKDLAKHLSAVNPQSVQPLVRYGEDPSVDHAAAVVESILGVSTFFDWESSPDTG